MKKVLIIISAIILIAIVVALVFRHSIATSGMPDYNEAITLKGLKEEVKVYRDEFGVPHIIAKNEEDLYRVTGYIIAQDRMWQMDLLRRVTEGRLSEIFGEKTVGADKLFRALRIPEKSEMILQESNQNIKNALEAFSDGVNQYIEKDNLSFEFKILGYKPELWKPEHSINLVGYMAWDLAMAWKMEMPMYKMRQKLDKDIFDELSRNLEYQKDVVFPEFRKNNQLSACNLINEFEKIRDIVPEIFNGSNNWVVSGKKSITGKPIFANDMHLGLMIPGVWTQIHQYIEGKVDVTGVILPGSPFVIAGHNKRIAWGMTNLMLDGMDFYVETVNEDSSKYKLNGEWKDFILKNEKIKIKGEESIETNILFTHRGPVISEFKNSNEVISIHWIGNEMSNEIRSLYLLNRAANWADFRDAVSTFKAVAQNIAYADIDGNIGLQACAGVPIRIADGDMVFPGDTDLYDWKGIHPFEDLPFSYNPECGYVYSANNRTTLIDSFYISAWYALPNRANRIKQMLTEKEKLSVDDFKKMQNDQHSVLVDNIKPIIIEALQNAELSEKQFDAFNKLANWNNVLSVESSEALIFEVMFKKLGENIIKDNLGEELYEEFNTTNYVLNKIFINKKSLLCDDINTKDTVETLDDMIVKSFKETIDFLLETQGDDIAKWRWGNVHKLILQHPLGSNKMLDYVFNLNRTYDVGGSFHTVSPYSYKLKNKGFISQFGASHRHIYSVADWDKSQSVIPTGISDVPASKHYCDQTDMYINGIYHNDYIDIEKIKESAVYTATFNGN